MLLRLRPTSLPGDDDAPATLNGRGSFFDGSAFGGAPVTLSGLPDSVDGVRVTLSLMVRLAREYRANAHIRQLAESIVSNVPEKNFTAEAEAITEWVKRNIRYTLDPVDIEMVKAPDIVLSSGQGDCDDKSLLLASLLESAGHPARFVALAFAPDAFEHVYVETKVGPIWVGAETTEDVPFGWSPPGVVSRMVRNIS